MESQPEVANKNQELIVTEIQHKKLLTISELCQKHNCEEKDLPKILSTTAKELFKKCLKRDNPFGNELDENIETLFLFFYATREVSDNDQLTHMARSLDNLDTFLDSQGKGNNNLLRARLIGGIHLFMRNYADHQGMLTATSFPLSPTMEQAHYFLEGKWLRLSPKYEKDVVEYIRPEVLNEAIRLIEENTRYYADFTHSTTSPALEGISREKALVSGSQVLEKIGSHLTGEDSSMVTSDGTPFTGGTKGHRYIFARPGVHDSYGENHWFDEYRVSFGTNKEDVTRNLDEENVPLEDRIHMYGDGYSLGRRFPARNISHIYTEYVRVADVKKWSETNEISAEVISYEAVRFLNKHFFTDDRQNKLTLEQINSIASSTPVSIK